MIIGAALALACRLIANLLLRMITVRLKRLPTVAATVKLHQAAPEESGGDSFSLEAPASMESEFQRRIAGPTKTHDYAV